MKYTFIVPVFNRPDEVEELLESLTLQRIKNFEVIIVEDGSSLTCEGVCQKYSDSLDLHYFFKANSGPGKTRNYGAKFSHGEYLIFLDSDVVLPDGYLEAIEKELKQKDADAFGGPDRAHESFTPIQKAISFSMTSFLTTGGIRGGKKKLDKFYPRSFNMGIKSSSFKDLEGFSSMRFGEDIDLSIRIFKASLRCRLFPEAWVWHKRRTDFRKFFRQVFNSGIARINLYKKYPESLKIVHLLPTVFTLGVICLILISAVGRVLMAYDDPGKWYLLCVLPWIPILLYALALLISSWASNKSFKVGLLSIPASFISLFGYGLGFLQALWKRCIRKEKEFSAFNNTFYK